MSRERKKFEYLVERIDHPAQLRIFRVAGESGKLLIPKCVAELRAESDHQLLTLLSNMTLGDRKIADGQPASITPVDLDSAVKSVIDFMSSHVGKAEDGITVEPEFLEVLAETIGETAPKHALILLNHMSQRTANTSDGLHTGFYL